MRVHAEESLNGRLRSVIESTQIAQKKKQPAISSALSLSLRCACDPSAVRQSPRGSDPSIDRRDALALSLGHRSSAPHRSTHRTQKKTHHIGMQRRWRQRRAEAERAKTAAAPPCMLLLSRWRAAEMASLTGSVAPEQVYVDLQRRAHSLSFFVLVLPSSTPPPPPHNSTSENAESKEGQHERRAVSRSQRVKQQEEGQRKQTRRTAAPRHVQSSLSSLSLSRGAACFLRARGAATTVGMGASAAARAATAADADP